MSARVYIGAIRDRLRTALTLTAKECDVSPFGRPTAMAGEFFIAVHPGGYVNTDDRGLSLDETYTFFVTVSVRMPRAPADRWGNEVYAKATTGLAARVEAVRVALHMNHTAMDAANTTLGHDVTVDGFVQPTRFARADEPTERPGSWAYGHKEDHAWMSQTLTFDFARRVQTIESMT